MAIPSFNLPVQDPNAPLSPETIALRRKMLMALQNEAMSTAPIAHWTQGAARMLQAGLAGLEEGMLDRQERAALKASDERQRDGFGIKPATTATDATTKPGGMFTLPTAPANPVGDVGGRGRAAPDVTGSPVARMAFDEFVKAGYPPAAAAALVGNMYAESGYNPKAVHDGGTGYGLYGYRDPTPGQGRRTNLLRFAQEQGMDPADPRTQVKFTISELQGPEAKAGEALRNATTVDQAMPAALGYLRPAGYTPQTPVGPNLPGRIAYSKAVFGAFGGGAPATGGVQTAQATPPGGSVGTPAAPVGVSRTGDLPSIEKLYAIVNDRWARPEMRQLAAARIAEMTKPRDEWVTIQGPNGTTVQRNTLTGEMKAAPDDRTGDQKDYALAVLQAKQAGQTPPSFTEWDIARKQAGASKVNMSTVAEPILEGVGKQFVAGREKAVAAAQALPALYEARRAFEGGIINGQFADTKLTIAKVLQAVGFKDADPRIDNSEVFRSAIGRQVLETVKALGSGSGISNADVKFTERVVGGDLALEPGTISRLFDIAERASRRAIEMHNADAAKIIKNSTDEKFKQYAPLLTVDMPPPYTREVAAPRAAPRIGPATMGTTAPLPGALPANPSTLPTPMTQPRARPPLASDPLGLFGGR